MPSQLRPRALDSERQRMNHATDSRSDDSCPGCQRHGRLVHVDRVHIIRHNEEDGEINWAKLAFGNSELMVNAGGRPGSGHRRDVDLYITTDNVDDLYRRLKDRVEVVEEIHDAFYGMREFITRDVNGFWVAFGQPVQTNSSKPCKLMGLAHPSNLCLRPHDRQFGRSQTKWLR
jgi:uncharacterized glyoxalase superfamily protein PhnB